MKTIVIIGAGAAGLACASELTKRVQNVKIIVLEQFNRSGRKILASGNGRCNISNTDMNISYYNTTDTKIENIITQFDPISFFHQRGMLVRQVGTLLYPYSNQALTVKNILLHSLDNVELKEECKVEKVISQDKGYLVVLKDEQIQADYVVYATGSPASKLSGTDNYDIARDLGLEVADVYPSLVQLKTKPCYKQISGVRTKARVSLYADSICIDSKEGEILFNDSGVSGICVMQVSRHYYTYASNHVTLHIDLLPDYTNAQIEEMMITRKKMFGGKYLAGIFNNKLASLLETMQDIDYKDWTLEVVGTKDYTHGQVMHGGIALHEVDEHLECHRYPNLYIVGEVLDVDGDCGGYNLHFAFASGYHVAKRISDKVNREC